MHVVIGQGAAVLSSRPHTCLTSHGQDSTANHHVSTRFDSINNFKKNVSVGVCEQRAVQMFGCADSVAAILFPVASRVCPDWSQLFVEEIFFCDTLFWM